MCQQSAICHDLIPGNITVDAHVWQSTKNYELILYYKKICNLCPCCGDKSPGLCTLRHVDVHMSNDFRVLGVDYITTPSQQ
jgi:hypothetical protein